MGTSVGRPCAFKTSKNTVYSLGKDRRKSLGWPQAGVMVKMNPSRGRVLRTAYVQKRSFEDKWTQ